MYDPTDINSIGPAVGIGLNDEDRQPIELTQEQKEARIKEQIAEEPLRLARIQREAIAKEIQALAPLLMSEFENLSEDEQVEFAGDFDVVERRLNNGQVAFAKAIIAAKKPQTENGINVQTRLIKALESVLKMMQGAEDA